MIDTSKIIYVPGWVKVTVIIVLGLILASASYFTFFYVEAGNSSDWVIVTMSIAQLAASALIVFMLLIYAERGTNEKRLREKSRDFMQNLVLKAMTDNVLTGRNGEKIAINAKIVDTDGPLFCYYRLWPENDPKNHLTVGMVFNLKRFAVYLYLPSKSKMLKTIKDAEDYFKHGMSISEDVGYKCHISESYEGFFEQRCLILSFSQENLPEDFIDKPINKLFYAQDISQMLKWYLAQRVAAKVDFL